MSKLYPKLQTGGLVPDKSQKTKLTQGQQLAYEKWKSDNKYNESDDYDLAGYWKEEGMKGLSFPNLSPIEKIKEVESSKYPTLDAFYKKYPHVAGMNHSPGEVSRNPYSKIPDKNLKYVIGLEKMRDIMSNDKNAPKPNYRITREQKDYFRNIKDSDPNTVDYIDTPKQVQRETIASRLYTGDEMGSSKYTKKQNKFVDELGAYADTKPYHLPDKFKRLAPFSNGDGYMLLSEESKYSTNPSYNLSDKNGNPLNTSFDKRGQGFWQGNQFIGYQQGGTLSQLGYKRHSPYNQASSLLIHTPTGSITMKEVDHPILGIGKGEIQIMHPEKEYKFKSNKVLEIPIKSVYPKGQNGMKIPKVYTNKAEFLKAKEAYNDSLYLHNRSNDIVKELEKQGFNKSEKSGLNDQFIKEELEDLKIFVPKDKRYYENKDSTRTILTGVDNKFKGINTKKEIPFVSKMMFHKNILPDSVQTMSYKDPYTYKGGKQSHETLEEWQTNNGKEVEGSRRVTKDLKTLSDTSTISYNTEEDALLYKKPNQPVKFVPDIPLPIRQTLMKPPTKKVERAPGLGGYNRPMMSFQQGGTTPEMSPEQQQEIVRRVRNLRKKLPKMGVAYDPISFRHAMYVNKKAFDQQDQELLSAFDEEMMVKLMNEVPDDDQPTYKKGGSIKGKSKMYPKCKCGCGGVSVGKNKMFQSGGTMDVLDSDGNSQMTIIGGERIFSRIATKKMLQLNEEGNYKELGKFICDELYSQDKREPQYVKE